MKLAKLPKSGIPTNGSILLPIRCATLSGITAAPASSARRASASRRSRSFRISASRFSASRDRSWRSSSEPALSPLDEEEASSSPPSPADGEGAMDVSTEDDDDEDEEEIGGEDFCFVGVVGFSPNPFPAERDVSVPDDDVDCCRRCCRTIGDERRQHGAVKALASSSRGPPSAPRVARGTTMAAMAAAIRAVATMILIQVGTELKDLGRVQVYLDF